MPYTVVPLRIKDHRNDLVKLWSESEAFGHPDENEYSRERFQWLYEDSPIELARTWLAIESESNAVVGCGSVYRSNKYVDDFLIEAGVAVNIAVDRSHRTAAAALAIQRAVLTESSRIGWNIVLGKPNDKIVPICSRVGYQTIGDIRRWTKVMGADGDAADSSDSLVYSHELLDSADARFDELWKVAKSQYRIAGEKASGFLNWRYNPAFRKLNYRYYCLIRREDLKLVAYLIYYQLRRGFVIVDLVCECWKDPILEHLLRGFVRCMQSEGSWTCLSYVGPSWFEDRLRDLGFENRHRQPFVVYTNPELPVEIRDKVLAKDNWFLFEGEMHFS